MSRIAGPRFGIWTPVYGTWGATTHPEDPFDASWERAKQLVLSAEKLGYDSTLIAQHIVNPYGHEIDILETWTAAAGLASLTSNIEIIAAIKPTLFHPVVLAKQALGIEEISSGRFSINVVNAWYKPELLQSGIPFAEHDERYIYGTEWLTIVRSLLTGKKTSFEGKYFHVDGIELNPGPKTRHRPTIYVGGESEPARDLAAGLGDVWFINGQPLENVEGLIRSVARRKREGVPVRFGLSAFVIARETEEEAQAELAKAWEYAKADEHLNEQLFGHADQKAVMFQTIAKYPAIGTNGGTAAGLVGSYDQVAERIAAFHEIGIELFMLQFQPFEAEMERFAREIFPRVRSLNPVAL
ncbi:MULTISPECIES: LLM class flavin-dependent oxidoreductase [Paenibacillus]|uniref:LLM class flavin-dependent oxidoreductase n=1 Tax=Paenibacillus validus TaxID=44253 RepID=A0A7X2Z849_9BACL|nr:LLM class flavin-dependent oxidoreductase [Paenibacillus validus]MUG70026.1 LLM class flavin-dependent oxidoreductase [Paenibacillus validus]